MSLKIISIFGDHSSLAPLFAKDVTNSLGMTAFSYDAGGKIEAKDKSIDEFGTQFIWIGGLPIYKWGYNKTAYKFAKLNPNVDIRLIRDKDQYAVASKYAKEYSDKLKRADIFKDLTDAGKNSKLFRNLFLGKFATATTLTLASFFTLVKVKQEYTKKQVEKEFWAKKAKEGFYKNNLSNSTAFKGFMTDSLVQSKSLKNNSAQNTGKTNTIPSFKGIPAGMAAFFESFMFDPVKNLFIVDAGITGERLASSRTKSEFYEYAIKEFSLLFLMYVAGRYIQRGIEKISEKFFKKPIDLHAEFLASDELKSSIKTGSVNKDVAAFESAATNNKNIYEFMYAKENADNIVVKAAKKSGILSTLKNNAGKDTGLVNPHQYIDPKNMKKLAADIKKLADSFSLSGENIDQFLKKTTKLKIASVLANVGVSCLFLGLIVPMLMLKYREKQTGNREFHVQREIQQNLENNFKARISTN